MSLALIAPAALIAAGASGLSDARSDASARAAHLPERAALLGLVGAAAASLALTLDPAGAAATLPGFRFDAVSGPMALLIAFIGWVVLRFARIQLEGEEGRARFCGWLALALGAALVFVLADHLIVLTAAWIGAGLCLQRLLLFRPDRPGARRAARKAALIARLGDAALLGAVALLATCYDTLSVSAISHAARAGEVPVEAVWAAWLLGLAACLKAAQFPTQGWLIEVMETPKPVSALLHAGLVNAGGFLLIRLSDVLLTAPGAMAALALIGGASALIGGLVMLAQPAVKTALAWSTVAQMGFMILQCGLGLFALALLHIVAHSLYKAHAFLGSGGAVEAVAAARRPGPVAIPNARAAGRAIALALSIYLAVSFAFGVENKSAQALALGAILVLGVAYLLAQGLADAAPRALTRRVALWSLAAAVAYFALQRVAEALTAGVLPPTPAPGPLEWAVIGLAVVSFAAVAAAQSVFPLWSSHPAAAGLRVHLANGLYAGAVFDRFIGGWATVRR